MIIRRLVLAVLLLAAPAANALDKDPYLFDMLKEPAYLAAWKAMLAGEHVPSWVASYAKTFDGPSNPCEDGPAWRQGLSARLCVQGA